MKILIATQNFGIVGGIETYLRSVLPRLLAAGHELALLAASGETPGGITDGCPDIPVWRCKGELPAGIAEWRPDVVYSHGLSDSRLEAQLVARFPTVFYAHGYHGTCVSGTKCQVRRAYSTCKLAFGLGCVPRYFPFGCGGRNPISLINLYMDTHRRASSLKKSRIVLVASNHMMAEFRRQGILTERLRLLPLFPRVTHDAHPPELRPSTGRILFVGRLTMLKGVGHLIDSVKMVSARLKRRLTLVLAGDGPDRASCEGKAQAAGVPAEFLGWVSGDRCVDEMRDADLLAVPSLWPEPFALVGIEAGCVGLPAVGYASGGIPDWLIPGVSGESASGVRPDPFALAAAIEKVLVDDTHRHRLAVGAWEMAGRFTAENHLSGLISAFTDAVRCNPIPSVSPR